MRAKEIQDLLISWFTISAAFAFAWTSFQTGLMGFLITFPIMLIVVGTGFIFHELAHKYVAIHFGCHAEYRAYMNGLVLAVVLALFFGIVFAAPGAVYIYGPHINRKQNGLISLAGPAANLIMALAFAGIMLSASGFIYIIARMGAYINIFLALFNLLPIFVLDGKKIFTWNPKIWAIAFGLSLLGFIIFQTGMI